MAEGFKGRAFVLKRGNGATVEVFTTVGGVRTTNMTINNNPVDVSDNASGWQKMLADGGIQSIEVSLDGIVKNNAVFEDLLQDAFDRVPVSVQLESGNADVYQGAVVVASLQRSGAHDGAETFSATLQSDGAFTYTPGA
jgi:predicted secreted protein